MNNLNIIPDATDSWVAVRWYQDWSAEKVIAWLINTEEDSDLRPAPITEAGLVDVPGACWNTHRTQAEAIEWIHEERD
jgi:hypothetical protein